jgi:CheY-like chemotaxis protein
LAEQTPTEDTKRTIVVVDDDPDVLEIIAFVLEHVGKYEVHTVTDSTRALDTIRAFEPQVVVTDVQMPDVDGLQLFELLRDTEQTRHIPVLFITGSAHDPRFNQMGIKNVLTKPVEPRELLERVAEVMH